MSGDIDVTSYAYGGSTGGPHAVTGASIASVSNTLTYDDNGAITKYDIAGTNDDKYIAHNANNQPTKIVIGSGLSDSTPVARDEFEPPRVFRRLDSLSADYHYDVFDLIGVPRKTFGGTPVTGSRDEVKLSKESFCPSCDDDN